MFLCCKCFPFIPLTLLIVLIHVPCKASNISEVRGLVITNVGPVKQLLLFEKSLIVGGRNKLFRLNSSNLSVEEQFKYGPVRDNYQCLPEPEPCDSRELTDSDVLNLLVFNFKSRWMLVACTSTFQGMCFLMPPTELYKAKLFGSPNKTVNFLASRESSILVSYVNEKNIPLIFVANSKDQRPLSLSPPTISSRTISLKGWKYTFKNQYLLSAIDIHPNFKKDFFIHYIFGFNYNSYVYFLKIESDTLPTDASFVYNKTITKLARICANDSSFHSYTEIQLTCHYKFTAQAAHLGLLDNYTKSLFHEEEKRHLNLSGPALFVSFSDGLSHSSICVYPLDILQERFEEALSSCYVAGTGARAKVFAGVEATCSPGQDYSGCGTGQNPYVASTRLQSGHLIAEGSGIFTSLKTAIQGPDQNLVIFAGNTKGEIIKFSHGELIVVKKISDSEIQSVSAIDEEGHYIYYVSDGFVIKFPSDSCSIYTDCGSCINATSKDPLKCIWNGKFCTSKSESSDVEVTFCVPLIDNFYPKRGPLKGGTIITIKGKDLGSTKNTQYSLTVAGSSCRIKSWTLNKITCETTPVESTSSGAIELEMKDFSVRAGYSIIGSSRSKEDFHYLQPQLEVVQPDFAPFSGYTVVTLKGKYLNIGSNITARMAGMRCLDLKAIDDENIECLTSPYHIKGVEDNQDSKDFKGPIFMKIDQQVLTKSEKVFSYLPDAIFTSIFPDTTVPSSPINVTISGENFNSLYKPRMHVKLGVKQLLLVSECTVLNKTTMECITPVLRKEMNLLTNVVSSTVKIVSGNLRSATDNIQELPLIYLPDPVFERKVHVSSGYEGDLTLNIYGQHLTTKYGMKIVLEKPDTDQVLECTNLNSISDKSLACDLSLDKYPGDPFSGEWKASVIIGKSVEEIGSVTLKDGYTSKYLILAVVAVCFLIVSVGIILLLIFRKNLNIGEKSNPKPLELGCSGRIIEQNSDQRTSNQPLLDNNFILSEEKLQELNGLLIHRNNLTLKEKIGEGNFGLVYKATLEGIPTDGESVCVAVKALKSSLKVPLNQRIGEQFLEEGLIMKDFQHDNVLPLIGIAINHDGWPMIVTPFMAKGNLLNYIKSEKNDDLSIHHLIFFGIQICEGMCFLMSQKFIHRDLAARNCLLDHNFVVKISDFGLTRDVYTTEYSHEPTDKRPLPYKWMAIESLEKGSYSEKSDVWSFGVTMWELVSRGSLPYADIENYRIKEHLNQNNRLQKPSECPEDIYEILKSCWMKNAEERPTFSQLLQKLTEAFQSEAFYAELKMRRFVNYVNCPPEFANPMYDHPKTPLRTSTQLDH